jgi:hypothetical protein
MKPNRSKTNHLARVFLVYRRIRGVLDDPQIRAYLAFLRFLDGLAVDLWRSSKSRVLDSGYHIAHHPQTNQNADH